MKYFTAIDQGQMRPGVAVENRAIWLSDIREGITDLLSFIQQGQPITEDELRDAPLDLGTLTLCAPIPKPMHDVMCIGKNYQEHILELDGMQGETPVAHYFSKRAHQIHGPNDAIKKMNGETMDYEIELAVIIGKEGKNISKNDAWSHVFGVSILNDLTNRALQNKHKQWFLGKSQDGYTAMGPWIVDAQSIKRPLDLNLELKVNGETRQRANTTQMIFSVESIIEELSKGITLYPGDIIATGTPSGVAAGMKTPKYLQENDVLQLWIEGIGEFKNTII